ncbi:hypothetical protein SAMN05216597_5069 [Pseudomonas cannabina]|nr:hypothetical protein SAMN05216597_5069 [Pseudomonas cannabina]
MSAKKATYFPKMNRLNYGLRGQVRSYTVLLLILAGGRRSELVREDFGSDNVFSEDMPAFSRTMRIAAPVGPTAFGQNQEQRCV